MSVNSTQVAFSCDWVQSGDIGRLISELNAGTELKGGAVQFKVRDHEDLFFLLADGIRHSEAVTRADISFASRRAFVELRKKGDVSQDALIREINKRIAKLQSLPVKRFTMWSKCRLKQMSFSPGCKFTIETVNIRTAARLPKWLQLEEHFVSGIGRIQPNILPFYGYVICSVNARSENEASKKIFHACDLLYAIVNTSWRSVETWVQRRPSAKLWLGPNQFFFQGRRFLGKDHVWYDQTYDEEIWNSFPPDAKQFLKRAPRFRRALKALQFHPLKMPLKRALILISEGMTSQDLSFRLMRFWSAAEVLYSAETERTSAKKLVSRISFASKEDAWLDKIKLERVYQLRNAYVHRGSRENDDSSLVQHLREVLLGHIYYYLWNADDITSQVDLLAMVDLPSEETALKRIQVAISRKRAILKTGRHRSKAKVKAKVPKSKGSSETRSS
jgi:hypothetical protein